MIKNKLYSGVSHKNILRNLLKNLINTEVSVSVICNQNQLSELSDHLWAYSIPHFIEGDPFIEQNHVFLADAGKPADCVILYENCKISNLLLYDKHYFIGTDHVVEGEYWILKGEKWQSVSKEVYYSKQ